MSTEIFSSTVHIPSARRSSVNEVERISDMDSSTLDVERMTFELKRAMDSYDEDSVLKAISDALSKIEDRFDVKFNRFQVTLANNRMCDVESDVCLPDGATKY